MQLGTTGTLSANWGTTPIQHFGQSMSTQRVQHLTPAEYLAIERKSEQKQEYFCGELFAMGGASRAHNSISLNIGSELRHLFREKDCVAFVADMRVKVGTSGLYAYPDIVATCQPPKFEDKQLDTLTNPQVIIEVLSKSTESYDRGLKFELYRGIESLSDYILVAQDRIAVDHFTRMDNGSWHLHPHQSLTDCIEIASIDCRLGLEDVYHKVQFEQK